MPNNNVQWRSTAHMSTNAQSTVRAIDCALADDDDWDEGHDQQQDQEHFPTYFASFSSSSLLPPLDEVTMSSEADSSSSDVSSVSSEENEDTMMTASTSQSPVVPRSIFGRYWEKKGGAPALTKEPIDSNNHVADSSDEVSCNTYERTLQGHEAAAPSTPPSRRRCIFSSSVVSAESAPALVSMMLQQQQQQPDEEQRERELLRKTYSTSALLKLHQRTSSCLRSSRFAPAPLRRESSCSSDSSSSDLSVTFSPKVDVVVYARPVELWAPKGWSDYFA